MAKKFKPSTTATHSGSLKSAHPPAQGGSSSSSKIKAFSTSASAPASTKPPAPRAISRGHPQDEEEITSLGDILRGKKRFDIGFIDVSPSSDSLEGASVIYYAISLLTISDIITNEYDHVQHAATINLLKSMEGHPSFGGGVTSPDVELLINQIESADPNTETNEDNLGVQWGHEQFKNWRAPLTSWAAIGYPGMARRLIAAMVKTAKVSRQLCQLKGEMPPNTCLADCYLQEAGELLWDLWVKANGVSLSHYIRLRTFFF